MEFHNFISGAVNTNFADDMQYDILGVNSFRECACDIELYCFRLAESTDPFENADLKVGCADAGGKAPKAP